VLNFSCANVIGLKAPTPFQSPSPPLTPFPPRTFGSLGEGGLGWKLVRSFKSHFHLQAEAHEKD